VQISVALYYRPFGTFFQHSTVYIISNIALYVWNSYIEMRLANYMNYWRKEIF
jgi:hypothetical protein